MQHTHQALEHNIPALHDLTRLASPPLHTTLRRENCDLAYLLGAWTSMTEIGGHDWLAMSFTSQDPRQLALIQQRVTALFDEIPPLHPFSIHGIPYLRVNVPSAELAHHVREVTSGNSRIPWEHLGTEEECKSFLRGIFDHGGWVYTGKSGGIGFNKKGGEALLEDLCRVFARVEVFPIVVYGDVPSLKLKDQAEWKGFAERVELSSAARREAVNALASRTSTRPHYSIDDYSNVIAFAKSSTLNSREVGEAMGIPTNTVRGWLVNGQQPPVVKRAQTIEGFTTTLGSPEVVNYVYRELGASSALARRCGHALDLRTAQRKSSFDQGDRARIYGDNTSLSTLLL